MKLLPPRTFLTAVAILETLAAFLLLLAFGEKKMKRALVQEWVFGLLHLYKIV